jgi:hypothetical protein
MGCYPGGGLSHIRIRPFIRWDEKASLRRDAIRSQWSTRSKRNRKVTGYENQTISNQHMQAKHMIVL